MHIKGKKVLILATHGFEQSELEVPRARLIEHGAIVRIAAPEKGDIRGWHKREWGRPVPVDLTIDQVNVEEYDALVLPGGDLNPDALRVNDKALKVIRAFFDAGKIVAAICHAPWLLIETGIAKGRRLTSYKSIKTDLVNAGATWEDKQVVADQGIITSRHPGDLEAFTAKLIEEIAEGKRSSRSAA